MVDDTVQVNEGEGNKTVARAYKARRRSAKSGQVGERAREAERALKGSEAQEVIQAEASGRRRTAKEDPAVHGNYHEKVKERAYAIWEREGRPHGRDREHWQEAEAEIAKAQSR